MVESVLRFAGVSRFVIADLSDPKWVLAELQQVVPAFRSLPVVPIIDRRSARTRSWLTWRGSDPRTRWCAIATRCICGPFSPPRSSGQLKQCTRR